MVQLTADALGADIDDVSTIQGDTAVTPYGAGTQGSRSGPMTAGAVNEAGTILRRQILTMAPSARGPARRYRTGWFGRLRAGRSREVGQLCRYRLPVHYEPAMLGPDISPTLEATARFASPRLQ